MSKIALVHDFLLKLGGGERVLKVLAEMYPDAPIYTLLYDEKAVGSVFPRERIVTSSLHNYPEFIRNRHKFLFPKMPKAIENFNFDGFDTVISSSSAYAHGIITPLNTRHISYCHSPMRYAWDYTHEYMSEQNAGVLKQIVAQYMLNKVRVWDKAAADRPDLYLANSRNVWRRIKKYYDLDSTILYPPVDVQRFKPQTKHEGFFLIVSTLTPYKKIDRAIHLFNRIKRQLIIIGDGPQRGYLQSIAGPTIDFLGFKDDSVVADYMQNCRAFIFPGEEDFGIAPIEAMAAGKPVLGYGKGGLLETVTPGVSGELFYTDTLRDMEDALGRLMFNEKRYRASTIRKEAERFSTEKFKRGFKKLVKG